MSFESNMKKIEGHLDRIASALEAMGTPSPTVTSEPETTTKAEPEPVVTTPSETTAPGQEPLTLQELEAFNSYLGQMVGYLGSNGQARILDVFKQHNVAGLNDIGEDRNLLHAIQADVQKLEPEGAAS